jgi:D-sedoheptulose 7-phosphate isomerase
MAPPPAFASAAERSRIDIRAQPLSIAEIFDEHLLVLERSKGPLTHLLGDVVSVCRASLGAGGKILLCGNGGSAADAEHFAAECVGRFERDRPSIPAIALTAGSSIMTAIANDYGYERLFERQVRAHARAGDVLFALSTSGNSPNVLFAARAARQARCHVVGFTGRDGGRLAELVDTLVAVPSTRAARIQEVHELSLHAIASELERNHGGGR